MGRYVFAAAATVWAMCVSGCLDFEGEAPSADASIPADDVDSSASDTSPEDATSGDLGAECTVDADCDDTLECTTNRCAAGICQVTVDPSYCAIAGTCYLQGALSPDSACFECQPADNADDWTARDCDDGDTCTVDGCNANGCTHEPVADGTSCDDGKSCNGEADSCMSGVCTGGDCEIECMTADSCFSALTAPPLAPCQTYSCVDNQCVPVADVDSVAPCNAGNPCIVNAACVAGFCVGESPCSADPCTDACTPSADGKYLCSPVQDDTACDDGNACTADDSCQNGACVGTEQDCSAFDYGCNAGQCIGGECGIAPQPDGITCATLSPANGGDTAGTCDSGVCAVSVQCSTAADCPSVVPCLAASCDGGQCSYNVFAGSCYIEGACYSADDGKASNQCMRCNPEVSSKHWALVSCPESDDPCSAAVCDPSQGCTTVSKADGASCVDGDNPCPEMACDGGACTATCECIVAGDCQGAAPACTEWACEEFKCTAVPNPDAEGQACEDGNFCTTDDLCQGGQCAPGTPTSCAQLDGPCVVGTCDTTAGECVAVTVADDTPCEDGLACTFETRCIAGDCTGSTIDCSAASGPCMDASCSESAGGACVIEPLIGKSCDDGNNCTDDDTCNGDGVCTGAWDTDKCGCQEDADCASAVTQCADALCNDTTGECVLIPVLGSCDDGSPCTENDTCSGTACVGTPKSCDDGVSCTDNDCNPLTGACSNPVSDDWCLIAGDCHYDGTQNPENPCEFCDSGSSTSDWEEVTNGTPCDDGQPCTTSESCVDGACLGGFFTACVATETCVTSACDGSGGCIDTIDAGTCLIDGVCVDDGVTSGPCRQCQADAQPTDWTILTGQACDDGSGCSINDTCQSNGLCIGSPCTDGLTCTQDICDILLKVCVSTPIGGSCVIDGKCIDYQQVNKNNQCEWCDGTKDPNGWSHRPDGAFCQSDCGGNTCQDGECQCQ